MAVSTEPMPTSLVQNIQSLPPLPAVAMRIIERLGDEYVDGNEIADIVSDDPAIAGRLIGLANSAFFGLVSPVFEMREVVNRVLGAENVRSLAFALATQQAFDTRRCQAFDARSFWERSLRIATYCKKVVALSSDLSDDERELAFILGLCQSLGFLVLAFLQPERLNTLLVSNDSADESDLPVAIRDEFGESLDALTAALAGHWQMPQLICKAYGDIASGTVAVDDTLANALAAARAIGVSDSMQDAADRETLRERLIERHANYLKVQPADLRQALTLSAEEERRLSNNAEAMSVS